MTLIFVSILLILLISTLLARKDIFEPYKIYILLYSALLAIYTLSLSRYQKPWSLTTILIFGGASFTFIGGCWLSKSVYKIKYPLFKNDAFGAIKDRLHEDRLHINWNWFINVYIVCAFIFIFAFIYAANSVGYIPALSVNPDSVRIRFIESSLIIGYGWYLGPISLMLASEIIIFGICSKNKKRIVTIVAIIVFLLYFSLNMRLDLFRFFILTTILIHYGKRQFNFSVFIYTSIIFCILFALTLIIRLDNEALLSLSTTLKLKLPKEYIWIANIYAYVVNNFWNFDYAIRLYVDGNFHYPTSYGFELFRPFLFLIRIDGAIQTMFGFDSPYNESVVMMKGLNSIIYVWHFYKDFGIFGALFIPFIAGISVSLMYYNLISSPSLKVLAFWGVIAGLIIFSYMVPLWSFWYIYMNIAIIWIAHRKKEIPNISAIPVRGDFT